MFLTSYTVPCVYVFISHYTVMNNWTILGGFAHVLQGLDTVWFNYEGEELFILIY